MSSSPPWPARERWTRRSPRKVADQSGGNPLFAEEMVNRLREEDGAEVGALPDSVHAVLAARLDALDADAAPPAAGGVRDRSELLGADRRTSCSAEAASASRSPSWSTGTCSRRRPSAASRRARVRLQARAGARRRLRTLPRAVALAPAPRGRAHRRGPLGREPRGGRGAARGALRPGGGARRAGELPRRGAGRPAAQRRRGLAICRRRRGVALLERRGAAPLRERAASSPPGSSPRRARRVEEASATRRSAPATSTRRSPAGSRRSPSRRDRGDPPRVGELHRKIGSGLWHKADRESSIAHFQQGIDLLKDGEPCRELIELYEEAASLYVETGDNMLAIYAAEKAQRLAEALGQSATASRTHLTFGRVFGRIGDIEQRAAEPRARGRAGAAGRARRRRSAALLALGRHLEVAEADYAEADERCEEALQLADELGDVPAQIELHAALGRLAVHPAGWAEVERHAAASAQLAEREGLSGQLCLPLLLQGISAWRRGEWDRAEQSLGHSREIATAGGRSEVAFLRRSGPAPAATTAASSAAPRALLEAAEICDRAGLIAQSAEASGARAVVLVLDGSSDVLLTDVVMPGLCGPDLARQLLERRPGLKAVYMSGYTKEAIVQHGVLDPGIAFLQKPFTSETLGRKIREVLNR